MTTDPRLLAYNRGPGHFVDADAFTIAPVPDVPPHRPYKAPVWYWVLWTVLHVLLFVLGVAAVAAAVDGAPILAFILAGLAVGVGFICPPTFSLDNPWRREYRALLARADAADPYSITSEPEPEEHVRDIYAEYLRNLELLRQTPLNPGAQTPEARQVNVEIVRARRVLEEYEKRKWSYMTD